MKTAPILTARDRVALVNASRTLARIVGELDGQPARRKRRRAPRAPRKELNAATKRAVAKARLHRSLRDVPEPE